MLVFGGECGGGDGHGNGSSGGRGNGSGGGDSGEGRGGVLSRLRHRLQLLPLRESAFTRGFVCNLLLRLPTVTFTTLSLHKANRQ